MVDHSLGKLAIEIRQSLYVNDARSQFFPPGAEEGSGTSGEVARLLWEPLESVWAATRAREEEEARERERLALLREAESAAERELVIVEEQET